MRTLITVTIPNEPFNSLVKAGTAGALIGRIMDDIRPEQVYYTEVDGQRTALVIVEMSDPSRIPSYAEPFFLSLDARCSFKILMTPDDLGRAGLDQLGRRWV